MGSSVFVGANPLGLALSPDGRFAIVTNARHGAPATPAASDATLVPGYSLAVVDTLTMKIAAIYHDASAKFYMGVAAARDPNDPARTIVLASDTGAGVVRVYDLDAAGQLTPEPAPIALPVQNGRRPFPAGIAIAPDGRTAYVADNLGNTVVAIDLVTRAALASAAVGDFPFFVAAANRNVSGDGQRSLELLADRSAGAQSRSSRPRPSIPRSRPH